MSYLAELVANAIVDINLAADITTLNNIRIKYLGKNSYLTLQITGLNKLPLKERLLAGANFNKAKKQLQEALNIRKVEIKNGLATNLTVKNIDISLPGRHFDNGSIHPVTLIINRIETFFTELGFTVATGPEVEDDYHNFDALNIPKHHPARTSHDTFWLDATRLLRTQTSSVQIRAMKAQKPPIYIIAPGRVYRNDNDKTHTPMFHQIEGLVVDKNISFTHLKWILRNFLSHFFEKDLQINFRSSYFPFTKLSAEVDLIYKHGKCLEILGCGMIHPNVLHNVGIDSEVYSGFAFGIGIERLAMFRYGINDIRMLFENDLRFLKQFK